MSDKTPKTIQLKDFLTDKEILLAIRLRTAKDIESRIIQPNLSRINVALGQENDARYLAYAVAFAVSQADPS